MSEIKELAFARKLSDFHLKNVYEGRLKTDSYSRVHCKRFAFTLNAIAANWPFKEGEEPFILNLGGRHFLDELLEEHFGAHVVTTDFDLRYPWNLPGKQKLILCTEVLEHLKDQEETDIEKIAAYTRTGLHCCLREIAAHLEPDGRAIISTPNCSSWEALRRWLGRESPMAYEGHPRELAFQEALREIRNCGLEIVESDTWPCYYEPAPHILKMVRQLDGAWHVHRDDTTYACVKAAL